jgi:hypothetical protein
MATIPQFSIFNRPFILISNIDHVSPLPNAIPSVSLAKSGSIFFPSAGTITEIGDGWYNIALSANDTDILGMLSYHIVAFGADPTDMNDEIVSSTLQPPFIATTPSIEGYTNWIRTIMGIPATVLPDNSPYIILSYEMAVEIVNIYLDVASPLLYTQAVYNLAADILVNIAQDIPPSTFWTDMRQSLGINNFTPGFINAANDEDTSAALLVPMNLQNLTIADLAALKTPWGRAYLAIAQSVGSMWGLTL